MELWYTEKIDDGGGLTIKIKNHLFHRQTKYQTIDIFDTFLYGRLMVIDGVVMLTEKDEYVYHECLTHVPIQLLDNPERVLIIGGGDGGAAREVLKYPYVREVVMVEIDGEVIEASKRFFPTLAIAFKDKRLKTFIADGAQYVKDEKKSFDLIIIDSTDPVGPGEVLFTEDFYRDSNRILKKSGIFTAQTESPFDEDRKEIIRNIYKNLGSIYRHTRMYLASIPTYPFGLWSFAFASQEVDPLSFEIKATFLPDNLKYYNRKIGKSIFTLPNFAEELINM